MKRKTRQGFLLGQTLEQVAVIEDKSETIKTIKKKKYRKSIKSTLNNLKESKTKVEEIFLVKNAWSNVYKNTKLF